MKLVHDIDGKPLQLLKTRLLEVEGSSSRRWTVTFKELRRAAKEASGYITIEARTTDNKTVWRVWPTCGILSATFDIQRLEIGCRVFSKYTFNKILKAAGVK